MVIILILVGFFFFIRVRVIGLVKGFLICNFVFVCFLFIILVDNLYLVFLFILILVVVWKVVKFFECLKVVEIFLWNGVFKVVDFVIFFLFENEMDFLYIIFLVFVIESLVLKLFKVFLWENLVLILLIKEDFSFKDLMVFFVFLNIVVIEFFCFLYLLLVLIWKLFSWFLCENEVVKLFVSGELNDIDFV